MQWLPSPKYIISFERVPFALLRPGRARVLCYQWWGRPFGKQVGSVRQLRMMLGATSTGAVGNESGKIWDMVGHGRSCVACHVV